MAQAQPAPSSFPSTIPTDPTTHQTASTYISLTPHPLSASQLTTFVRSPSAGATVLFIGTTRDTFATLPVSSLSYTSYIPLAMSTLRSICSSLLSKHEIEKIAIVHRLGEVGIGEESIVIAVSAKHRQAAWRAGEEALEEAKRRAEIWKLEKFVGGEGVWRANRDGVMGVKVEPDEGKEGREGVENKGESGTLDVSEEG
ncbi:molybdenum cofactor synthesis protein-like protein 2 large subunit [Clohesyomyces aquaticus]|uniref:Molybdopterin synthase catalytic subunit n=1 Tax=Clohesyomyces aquaticus TaxID=1231657 RepID=A0A1Y1ZGW9_9PLEO|nr:molybdenum cofactor synthesis protein-like protein 2 large subunit [Clohesyomyces aquaticus]